MTTRKTTKNTTGRKAPAAKKTNPGEENLNAEFPGYPKYSADEDITRRAKRVDENLDDEVLTQVKHNKELKKTPDESSADDTEKAETSESNQENNFDVTNEDLEALGPKDLSMDMGEDEQLKHRTRPVDFAGKDLDVPGSELDDDQEEKGSEDEENNSYSLGGDDKESLGEGQEHEGSL
ncbi:MAG TPA: hypothetical protein VK508_19800 [Cyclobacteriaceae bacterium]|nr:hypothetical protein [Cyclobacteriaceae bacterium]